MTTVPPNSTVSYRLENVSKQFPGILAVNDVNMEVRKGEIHGIIGKNGAGKSVTVSIIAGVLKATSGTMWAGGDRVDLTSFTPSQAHNLGVALIPQEPLVYLELSVADNLFMGTPLKNRLGFLDHAAMRRIAQEIGEKMTVKFSSREKMGDLRIEDQQLMAFGRALFIQKARIVLLDEITASLSRNRKDLLLSFLRETVAQAEDLSFTLITHHIDEVIAFCDRVTVMRDGSAVATLNVAETNKAELAALVVGEEAHSVNGKASRAPRTAPVTGGKSAQPAGNGQRPIITVNGLEKTGAISDVHFEVMSGEVLGVAGLDGSGKDTVLQAMAGIVSLDAGEILVDGKRVRVKSPEDAFSNGIAYLPKKREEQAVIHNRSVEENTLICIYSSLRTPWQLIDRARARKIATERSQDLRVKTLSLSTNIDNLSGGNRQKVILNRVSLTQPRVFVLNEPTRGVDLATKPEILKMIREQFAQTGCVIVTSESEEELIETCDRILVFYQGKIQRTLKRGNEDFTVAEAYKAIQGVQ